MTPENLDILNAVRKDPEDYSAIQERLPYRLNHRQITARLVQLRREGYVDYVETHQNYEWFRTARPLPDTEKNRIAGHQVQRKTYGENRISLPAMPDLMHV